jgi:hypothetical protein
MRLTQDLQLEQVKIGQDIAYLIRWEEANAYFAKELATRIKANIADYLVMSGYPIDTVRRWLNEIQVEYAPGYVAVRLRSRTLRFVEFGTRASKPKAESRRPVPIRLPNGTLIFRRVTYKSLMKGAWRRPARPGRFIVREAILNTIQDYAILAETNIPLLVAKIDELLRRRQAT